jgi:hypothetical protein
MDLPNLLNNFSSLNASSIRSSLTSSCYLYTTSKVEDGKYPKQLSKGDLPIEVHCSIIRVLYIDHIFIPRSSYASDFNP